MSSRAVKGARGKQNIAIRTATQAGAINANQRSMSAASRRKKTARVSEIDSSLRQERAARSIHAQSGNRAGIRRSAERTSSLSDERGRLQYELGRKGKGGRK